MAMFSLICGTAGRVNELTRMLQSLAAQTFRDFELILIDQNCDDRVLKIIDSIGADINIQRIVATPGLCKALNIGLREAEGEIIGFPDDDCWYPSELLRSLSELLISHPAWDGVTVPTKDENGTASIARWAKYPGRLTPSNLGLRGCSTSVFYRRTVCSEVGFFDETIGGSVSLLSPGSDMDYLHRVVQSGFHMEYQPQLTIHHPQTLALSTSEAEMKKRYIYGYGEGWIARKYALPIWYPAAIIGFPLTRAITKAALGNRRDATREWVTFRGRLHGWKGTLSL